MEGEKKTFQIPPVRFEQRLYEILLLLVREREETMSEYIRGLVVVHARQVGVSTRGIRSPAFVSEDFPKLFPEPESTHEGLPVRVPQSRAREGVNEWKSKRQVKIAQKR